MRSIHLFRYVCVCLGGGCMYLVLSRIPFRCPPPPGALKCQTEECFACHADATLKFHCKRCNQGSVYLWIMEIIYVIPCVRICLRVK